MIDALHTSCCMSQEQDPRRLGSEPMTCIAFESREQSVADFLTNQETWPAALLPFTASDG